MSSERLPLAITAQIAVEARLFGGSKTRAKWGVSKDLLAELQERYLVDEIFRAEVDSRRLTILDGLNGLAHEAMVALLSRIAQTAFSCDSLAELSESFATVADVLGEHKGKAQDKEAEKRKGPTLALPFILTQPREIEDAPKAETENSAEIGGPSILDHGQVPGK